MDKGTELSYMQKVVGYCLENTDPMDSDRSDLLMLTKAQNMITNGQVPAKHMAYCVHDFREVVAYRLHNSIYNNVIYDKQDIEHTKKLLRIGKELIDNDIVTE